MTMFKKLAVSALLISFITPATFGAYEEVSCTISPDFTANSCSQCFTGGAIAQGENKGLLTDVWENTGSANQVLFKEEQELPKVIGLGGATWQEVKASESVDFWQYTAELDALYDEDNLGYTLEPKKTVTWLESTLGSAYQLVANPVSDGGNVGIIAYDIATHEVEAAGSVSIETDVHRECVLFTSAATEKPVTPVEPETPTKLPETGPEHILLVLAALLLGFGFLKFRRKV